MFIDRVLKSDVRISNSSLSSVSDGIKSSFQDLADQPAQLADNSGSFGFYREKLVGFSKLRSFWII